MARFAAKDVTVFTLDSNTLITVLDEASIEITLGEEDSAAINEISYFASPVSRTTQITGSAFVDTGGAKLIQIANSTTPQVAVSYTTGGNAYTGTFLVMQAGHQIRKKTLQKQSFTFKSQGAVTITAPS
jgi:hypothetical protein